MRILTWNINGIRTMPRHHPTLKDHEAILNYLEADIINFQEVKSTRAQLPAPVALPPSFDAYYSFPLTKKGYSGVATYTAHGVTALKAEEGLTGRLCQPHLRSPLSEEEHISTPKAYGYEQLGIQSMNLKSLDAEGRVLTLDFGLFILINVYCPSDGSTRKDSTRFDYKMAFHHLLEARVRGLIREGREVILLGDLNAYAAADDYCEGDIIMRRAEAQGSVDGGEQYLWAENRAGPWLKDILEGEKKCLVDVVRRFHPKRQGMFTWWNNKLSARVSNYGVRLDYVLVTPGLLPWIKGADIEPKVKGSDHCPVWIELFEEIEVDSDGGTMKKKLRNAMCCNASVKEKEKQRDPPRLATKFWDEYSGKQRLLESFFTTAPMKGKTVPPSLHTSSESLSLLEVSNSSTSDSIGSKKRKSPSTSFSTSSPSLSSIPFTQLKKQKRDGGIPNQSKWSSSVAPSIGKGKAKAESMAGSVAPSTLKSDIKKGTSADNVADAGTGTAAPDDLTVSSGKFDGGGLDDDILQGTIQLSLLQSSSSSLSEAWKSVFTPPEPPRCAVHDEVAKKLKVTKPGINKGRGFWVCSRPVGPGYDKGRSERPREEVDPKWKCDFFIWSSDLAAKHAGKSGK